MGRLSLKRYSTSNSKGFDGFLRETARTYGGSVYRLDMQRFLLYYYIARAACRLVFRLGQLLLGLKPRAEKNPKPKAR